MSVLGETIYLINAWPIKHNCVFLKVSTPSLPPRTMKLSSIRNHCDSSSKHHIMESNLSHLPVLRLSWPVSLYSNTLLVLFSYNFCVCALGSGLTSSYFLGMACASEVPTQLAKKSYYHAQITVLLEIYTLDHLYVSSYKLQLAVATYVRDEWLFQFQLWNTNLSILTLDCSFVSCLLSTTYSIPKSS